jgi:uncharacterized protein (TIGR02172 family)
MRYGKIIGTGNTAVVYEWKKGKVLKLFQRDYPREAVKREFSNAKAISHMAFAKPRAYKLIFRKGQAGIVYDKVEGISLLDWVIRTYDIQGCGAYMAELHKEMLKNTIRNVPNYKNFLERGIKSAMSVHPDKQQEMLQMLDKLPDGDTFCHGDFHPGNIFLSEGKATVIDFMNVCHGHFLYDVARTVFLLEYTPVPAEAENREELLQFKKSLAASYLAQMGIARESIRDYLSVIAAARAGECPGERPDEA